MLLIPIITVDCHNMCLSQILLIGFQGNILLKLVMGYLREAVTKIHRKFAPFHFDIGIVVDCVPIRCLRQGTWLHQRCGKS